MRTVNKIIIHCSDSDTVDDIETVRKWHIEERGFSDIGYHFFINKKGELFKGRDIEKIGAHCEGQNHDSIGICVSGRKEFTGFQFLTLRFLVSILKCIYGIKDTHGHNEFNKNKTCPNFDIKEVLK